MKRSQNMKNKVQETRYILSLNEEIELFGRSPDFREMINQLLQVRLEVKNRLELECKQQIKHLLFVSATKGEFQVYFTFMQFIFHPLLDLHFVYNEIQKLNLILYLLTPNKDKKKLVDVERIKQIPIESVIANEGINLKSAGAIITGLCPFHQENHPSFTVYPNTFSFYCFGCNEGGDVISFIQRLKGISFYEAILYLSKNYE